MSNQIEFRHLRYFMAVSETLNFHRAAEKLDITQPGLSRQIQQLEFHLGTELLVRNRREVRLTPAGDYLRHQLIPQMNRLEHIYRETRRIGTGQAGEIRIGFLGSAMQDVIPRLLVDLNREFPEIRTSLEELSNRSQVRALLEERLDLGFVRLSDLPADLEGCPMIRETFSIVVPEDHRIDKHTLESVRDFSEEPFILFTPEYSPDYYRTVLSICEDSGFHPKISHKSVHAHTIFKLVAAGLGVAIVPTSLQHGFRLKVRYLELTGIRQRAVLTAVWNRSHHSRALEHCIERLKIQSAAG